MVICGNDLTSTWKVLFWRDTEDELSVQVVYRTTTHELEKIGVVVMAEDGMADERDCLHCNASHLKA